MIKSTFAITKVPFLQSDLKPLSQQQETIDVIKVQSQNGGLCVITGEPGVGKTAIKTQLEKMIKSTDCLLVSFSRTMDTYSKILHQLAESLELEFHHRKLERDIITAVFEQARRNKTLITIIDEAHLLDPDSLRRLRLLFDRFPRKHVLVLIGQPDLMVRLSLKNNEDIRSRITHSAHLKPLNEHDMLEFIQRECDAVKLPKGSFEEGALELIIRSARGNLRLCANLCYGSLLEACRQNERVVDHAHVNAILIQPHWRSHEDLLTGQEKR